MLNAGLFTPPGGSKSRLKSRLTFNDLFIFFCRDPIATTSPPRLKPPLHGQGVKMQFTHERKNMGRYHALQLLGKIPESLPPACGFFSHLLPHPSPPQLHVSLLLSGAGDIYARENYYFSISRSSQNIGLPHLPVLLIHSRLCPFLPALSVCHLLPSTSAISH